MSSSDTRLREFAKPKFVTGACLCGSLRYKVVFPPDHDFRKSSGSCQCTQCRRNTGSLIAWTHGVSLSAFTYTTPSSTLRTFNITDKFERGFCMACGSFMYWRDELCDEIYLALGTVDPEYLVGEPDKDEGYGYALANCCGSNIFCENEIKGVTEGWIGNPGNRWARTSNEGIPA